MKENVMLMNFFVLIFWLAIIALACMFLYIPIMIANSRGVCGAEKTAIVILSWLGIFFGLTWFIALIMSLFCSGDCTVVRTGNLDDLEKLARLYKEKAITKQEYEKLKSQILG